MRTKSQIYGEAFGLEPPNPPLVERAFALALDTRKFETGLYWQRATYFWTLIAAAFAGYFAVLAAEKMPDKEFNAFVIACIGFVFSVAWFLVNRGSKFWQENWENHVDMLEDPVVGPLHKTILRRPADASSIERWIDGPMPISVSKVNQWVSLFTLMIWIVLACNVLPSIAQDAPVSIKHSLVGVLALLASGAIALLAKSHLGDHRHAVLIKQTAVMNDEAASSAVGDAEDSAGDARQAGVGS